MQTCFKCGGIKYQPNEMAEYVGNICICDFKMPITQYPQLQPPNLMPVDEITLLRNEMMELRKLVMLLRDEVRNVKRFK